jgi:hypothetical protein
MAFYQIQPVQIPVVDPNNVGQYTMKTANYVDFPFYYQAFQTTLPFGYSLYTDQYTSAITAGSDVLGEEVVSQWGDNDDYIINAMALKIGVTIIW